MNRITGARRQLIIFTSLTSSEVDRVDTVAFGDTSTYFHHNGVIVTPTGRGFAVIQNDELSLARLPDSDVLSGRKIASFLFEEVPINGDGYYAPGVYAYEGARAVIRSLDEESVYLQIESANLEDAQYLYEGILEGTIEAESYFNVGLASILDTILTTVENIPAGEALSAFAGVRGRIEYGVEEGELADHPALSSEPVFIARLENGLAVAMFIADVAPVTAEQQMPAEAAEGEPEEVSVEIPVVEPVVQPEDAAMTDSTELDTAAEPAVEEAAPVASEPQPEPQPEPPAELPITHSGVEAPSEEPPTV